MRCELSTVDTQVPTDRIEYGEKVRDFERFGVFFLFRALRSLRTTSNRKTANSSFAVQGAPSLRPIPPAEGAVTGRSLASTWGVPRCGVTRRLYQERVLAASAPPVDPHNGIGLAVVLDRTVASQSWRALNEKRAQE